MSVKEAIGRTRDDIRQPGGFGRRNVASQTREAVVQRKGGGNGSAQGDGPHYHVVKRLGSRCRSFLYALAVWCNGDLCEYLLKTTIPSRFSLPDVRSEKRDEEVSRIERNRGW